ncbi:MAG: zinc ABC transporter substrate-binding protein [Deltaproteobacteria bacterium]|nr:zinc ABC transporter substrate-binding protein [Deltaproteobacteria bacterium]
MNLKSVYLVATFLFAACILAAAPLAHAKLRVVTTVTDLRAITEEVCGDLASVEAIAKGTQDPHYIEAKPSFMVKASRADLMISIGLDLEIGWLPSILRGARNPSIMKGQQGYLEVGPLVEPLEVSKGEISRAMGDIHPFGNPHVTIDPIRAGEIAVHIAKRLGELDSGNAARFLQNATALKTRLEAKTKLWQARIDKTGVKSIVTYHKTLTYFFDRFKIAHPAILEPKPGIPPTSGHIIDVIQLIRAQKIPLIFVENFFDPTVTNKIKQDVPSVRAATVAVSVDGAPGISKIDDLYENLVKNVEGH